MGGVDMLEDAFGHAGDGHCLGVALGAEQRLGGVLEHDRVARQQRRDDRVHRGEVRVVPRSDDEHRAHRVLADEAGEAVLVGGGDIGQRRRGDRVHVARPLLEPAVDLERGVADRPPHLPGQLGRDGVDIGLHRLHHLLDERRPFGQGRRPPPRLCGLGPGEDRLDLGGGRGRPFGIHRAIDGGNDLLKGHVAEATSYTDSGSASIRSTHLVAPSRAIVARTGASAWCRASTPNMRHSTTHRAASYS